MRRIVVSSLHVASSGGGTRLRQMQRVSSLASGVVHWLMARGTGKTLVALKKKQRDQVEELKRKTGYYSTRSLLEKYDEVIKKNVSTAGRGDELELMLVPSRTTYEDDLSLPNSLSPLVHFSNAHREHLFPLPLPGKAPSNQDNNNSSSVPSLPRAPSPAPSSTNSPTLS